MTFTPCTIHSVFIGRTWTYCSATFSLLFTRLPVICHDSHQLVMKSKIQTRANPPWLHHWKIRKHFIFYIGFCFPHLFCHFSPSSWFMYICDISCQCVAISDFITMTHFFEVWSVWFKFQPKMNILSWFTHSKHDLQLHVPPKQYDLLSCVEYKRKHFEMCSCFVCVCIQ